LLICREAFQQAGSGRWCAIGIHDRIAVSALPAMHSPLVAYLGLGGFAGEAMVTLTIRDSEDQAVQAVQAVRAMLPKTGVLALECALPFPPVPFRREGSHALELLVDGEVVAVRSFRVQVAPAAGPG
jgi:hypothetical protein